ncbi:E3 ubiquitin-protein ligase RNF152 [Arapaima gigas]
MNSIHHPSSSQNRQPGDMETLSQDSILECQICFNYYSPRRRPKLLDCRHTCCSVCLTQMRTSQREVRCPWCRDITRLPAGFSVSQLPDDPAVIAVVSIPHASEQTPVYFHLPGSGCYLLPLGPAVEGGAPLPGEVSCWLQQKGMAAVEVSEPEEGAEGGRHRRPGQGSTWSGVCTVMLVACVLLFLLGIVLHNMSCISKRLTVISCG